MTFEQHAENLLEDFNTRILDENGDIYTYSPKHYDIAEIFLSYGINDDDKDFQFNIEDARNLISIILEVSWDEIIKTNKYQKEIYELKLGSYKTDSQYDINDFDSATFWIEQTELNNNTALNDEAKLELYKYYLFENQNDDMDDLQSNGTYKSSNQTTADYFRQQAKLLLKDYNLMKENKFDQSKIVFDEPQKHFDIINVFTKANKPKCDNLTLMNIQHILVKICDFENWDDFLHSSKAKQEIGALKLNYYKIGMDPNIIDAAEMMVEHELFAEFVDDDGDVNYTDDDELEMWKYVLERV